VAIGGGDFHRCCRCSLLLLLLLLLPPPLLTDFAACRCELPSNAVLRERGIGGSLLLSI
jgi:hypothetical protein